MYEYIPEPNLEPPEDTREIIGQCRCCGEPIREGDSYYELDDYEGGEMSLLFCESCVDSSRRYS